MDMRFKQEELYRVDVAARRLGLANKTLRNQIDAGRINVFRIGRSVRVAESEIQRILEESFCPARRTA